MSYSGCQQIAPNRPRKGPATGEITLSEIQALPFVEDAETADEIAERLIESFDAQRLSRRRRNESLVGAWEDVVRLQSASDRSPANLAAIC